MAVNRKTYQTAFELSAKLDSNYKKTIEEATAKIKELEESVSKNKNIINDISGYEKAQRQLEKLSQQTQGYVDTLEKQKAALKSQEAAYQAVIDKYAVGGEEYRKQEAKIESLNHTLEANKLKYREAVAQLDSLKESQAAAATVTESALLALRKMNADYEVNRLAIEAAEKELEKYKAGAEATEEGEAKRRARIEQMKAAQELLTQRMIDARAKLEALTNAEGEETLALEKAELATDGARIAVEKTTSELDKANAELAQMRDGNTKNNAELERAKKALDGVRQKLDKANANYSQHNQKVKEAQQAIDKYEKLLKMENVDLADLEKAELNAKEAIAKMNAEIKVQEQVSKDAKTGLDKMNDGLKLINDTIVTSGLLNGVKKLTGAFKDIMSASMSFEYQMSAVEALANDATADEIEQLNERAQELGKTTVFSATESASALTYLAQAGWDAKEMLAGVDAVVQLAAASGTDMAQTSSIMADTMAGFGYEAEQAARVADVLAQAAASSNTNVELLGDTFANSASLAGAMGMEIEDVATAIGLMANAGVKGSRAATAMKNIFSSLSGDVKLSSSAFGDVEYQAYDESGNFKSFGTIMTELRGYFEQMSPQEVMANAEAVAGKRGFNALAAIMNATEEEYQTMHDVMMASAGAAAAMAETRLDNLQGDITLLKSAWEGLEISLGEVFTPVARKVVEIVTDMVAGVQNFVKKHPGVVRALGALAAGLTTVVTVLAGVAAAMKVINILMGIASGPMGWVALGIGAAAAFGVWVAEISTSNEELQKLDRELDKLNESYEKTLGSIDERIVKAEDEAYYNGQLINTIIELNEKSEKTDEEYWKMYEYVELLNESMPDLNLFFDEQTETLSLTNEQLKEYAENLENAAKADAYYDYWKELYREQIKAQEVADEAEGLRAKMESEKGTAYAFAKYQYEHGGILGFLGSMVGNLASTLEGEGALAYHDAYQSIVKAEEANGLLGEISGSADEAFSNYLNYSGVDASNLGSTGAGTTVNVYLPDGSQEDAIPAMEEAAETMSADLALLSTYN